MKRWLALAWPGLASAAAIVLVGASALVGSDHFRLFTWHRIAWKWVLIFIAAVVLGAAAVSATTVEVRQARRIRRASRLEARAEAAEIALVDAVWEELEELANHLCLYSDGRVSLFLCYEDHFVLAGRYSANPPFQRTTARPSYPIDQGIIGAAWARGKAADDAMPDPSPITAARPTKGWLDQQLKRHGVPEEVAVRFTMKSRSYAAVRLDRPHRRLGVLVLESTRVASETTLSQRAGGLHGGSLEALLNLADAGATRRLARALEDLSLLGEEDLRRHLATVLAKH